MALTTYAELLTSIAAWMKPNTTLPAAETALIPDYVVLLEAEANRKLMHPKMEAVTTLTFTNGVANIPTGLRNVRKIQLTQSPFTILNPVDADIPAALTGFSTGSPNGYKWTGTTIQLDTYASVSASIAYRKALTGLAGGVNWLYQEHPDYYLFGSVLQADTRLIDNEQLDLCERRFDRINQQFDDMLRLQHMGVIQVRPSQRAV